MLGYHPPGADTLPPWGQTPPGPGTPPGTRHPPRDQAPPPGASTPSCAVHVWRYRQQSGGMHPTGIQSCLRMFFEIFFFQNLSLPFIRYKVYSRVISDTPSPVSTELSVVGKHTLAILKYFFELLLQCILIFLDGHPVPSYGYFVNFQNLVLQSNNSVILCLNNPFWVSSDYFGF